MENYRKSVSEPPERDTKPYKNKNSEVDRSLQNQTPSKEMDAPDDDPSTLQPGIPWLADSYRFRLQQEERDRQGAVLADRTDSFVLCSKDRIESYAEHRLLSCVSGNNSSKPRCPESCQGSRQTGNVRDTNEPQEWKGLEFDVEGEGRQEVDDTTGEHYVNGFAKQCENRENVDIGHALWLAAKRKHYVSRPSSAGSPPSHAPRPSSAMAGHIRNSSLPSRSSSAMAVQTSNSFLHSTSYLKPSHDSHPSRPSSAMSVHTNDSDSRFLRPSSVMARPSSPVTRPSSPMVRSCSSMSQCSDCDRPSATFRATVTRRRPTLASVYSRRELAQQREARTTQKVSRPSSASASLSDYSFSSSKLPPGHVYPHTLHEKRLHALYQAWTHDPRSSLYIGVGGAMGPSPHLMDRHARCLDLRCRATAPADVPERPYSTCGLLRTTWEGGDVAAKKEEISTWTSEEDRQQQQQDCEVMSHVQRYMDCHRPASAPRMRKELEGAHRRSVGIRGRSPHFCNFVQKAGLHSRYDTGHTRPGSGSEEEGGRQSQWSDASAHDNLAHWRKSRLTSSGTEGRPGSPSSMDGKSRIAGQNSVASQAKLIPVITIPSSSIPTGDQLWSNRSSGESSPRKLAREELKLQPDNSLPAEKSPKPQHLTVSLPTPPPKEEKEKTAKGKRLPVTKKTRKGGDRRLKSKTVAMHEAVPLETSASGDPAASGDDESQPPTNGLDVKAKVPDLPELTSSGKKNVKKGKKSQRRLIATPHAPGEKPHLPQELLDLDASSKTGYDFGELETTLFENHNNKYRPLSWLNTRMALSQQASRFELPMDMKELEEITPQEYLRKFCVVTSRRINLYQKIFMKHKDKGSTINKQGLETCLKETLVQQLKENTFTDLCELLDITDDTVIDFKLFAGVAAITERILYPHYTTEDTVEKPEYQRERIETADFSALDWKLHGIRIGDKMKKLLKTIE